LAKPYRHRQEAVARPEAGAAPRFRAKAETATYRYDSSLSPAMDWDEQPARSMAEWLLAAIAEAAPLPGQVFPEPRVLHGADGKALMTVSGLQDAVGALKRMQAPFLDWAGKAERLSFDVPTLPLFVHERLSTEAIIKTLEGHRRQGEQADMFDLFADPKMPLAKQVDAYAHKGAWANRMILGDSLSVMNSLARYEGLGGQVQMIYLDPPYGVKFGSNFQPFVRKREVNHGDDTDMTREPEMVQAYRDTWTLGLHSYLAYLRDRIVIAKELLAPSGSVFVQISDDNLHHVCEIMAEVFGSENFVSVISFVKTSALNSPDARLTKLATNNDFLVWYARDISRMKFRQVYRQKVASVSDVGTFNWVEQPDGSRRALSADERVGRKALPEGRLFARADLTSQKPTTVFDLQFNDRIFNPLPRGWRTTQAGMSRLIAARRIFEAENSLRFVQYLDDFAVTPYGAFWDDTGTGSFTDDKVYVVQTPTKAIQRCMLMATDPGDLVLDPTCGSGTTAYVAEQWGRRWITIDTSRVPLALARQRLLTATFPWYRLRDAATGPASGFVYARRQNRKGEEVGGIVPHVTLKSIANNEPPAEEVLVDRPEVDDGVTRVSGPFVVEAVLPTPQPLDGEAPDTATPEDAPADHVARMIEVLRRSPTLRLPGGGAVTLRNIRRPAKTLNLSAEAVVDGDAAGATASLADAVQAAHEQNTGALPFSTRPVAVLFGPPHGAVTAKAVLDAAKEANVKGFAHLYVIGFGFTSEAQAEIEAGEAALGIPASKVEMTHDVMMGDLLKTQRSSQIFSITGSPEIAWTREAEDAEDGTPRWRVRLMGLDTFDPVTMEPHHLNGDDVPMWMLDIGWNGMAFSADQVFFPRTKAWDNLRKALKSTHDDSVWTHLAGDTSAPFAAPAGTEIAVKVLDDRGNELLKIAKLG
jgi:adenine-specific DNA-methyltransferase